MCALFPACSVIPPASASTLASVELLETDGARMLHFAEDGNKALRKAGHIDHVVASQAQIGQGVA